MTKTLTIRLEEKTIEQLKEIAKSDLRTIGKTVELLVREHLARGESLDEYCAREKPYIDHAMEQEGMPMKFEEVFHD